MSDTSSVTSCGSCESLFHEDEKPRHSRPKKIDHFLKRLYRREVGLSELKPTFPIPPPRLKFPLNKTLPTAIHSHIFLGISSCGQLLITYTYTTDFDDRPISFNTIFKYRLHWWAFVPYAVARKVAEVTLFGNYNVYTPLYLAYCQWPKDSSKIVVFGRSNESNNGLVTQNVRSYVTVTAVPSLQNCQECQKVAASFEEEDIAASWDSCARLNCVVHGLTVHTSFDMAPPYPKFVATTSMKSTGRVVLNSGNFLHVIRVGLENVYDTKSCRKPSDASQLQSEQFIFRSRSITSSNLNVRLSEYQNQALIGLDVSSPVAASPDHIGDNPSMVEELSIISQGYVGISTTQTLCCRTDSLTLETDSDASSQRSAIMSPPLRRRAHSILPTRSQQGRLSSKAEKAYDFNEQKDERIYESLSSFRKRRLADKKYEFSEEDTEDSENIVPFRLSRQSEVSVMSSPTYPLPPSPLAYCNKDRNANRSTASMCDPTDGPSNLRWKSFAKTGSGRLNGETSGTHSPGSIFIDLNIEPDKVVLRPHNRNNSLLSPREQDLPRDVTKKCVVSHSDNSSLSLSPSLLTPPPPPSPAVRLGSEKSDNVSVETTMSSKSADVVRSLLSLKCHDNFKSTDSKKPYDLCANADCAKNASSSKVNSVLTKAMDSLKSQDSTKVCDQFKTLNMAKACDNPKSKEVMRKSQNDSDKEKLDSEIFWSKGGCTVQFERRFIEVDDELVSVITDIEDDDESGSTGFHSALPLEVHGTGYVQMQMISNAKAEKLMAPCALVHQMSFDIEQFCHEVAEVLCERAGMKFWYCNNYDVEIVDVCPLSADVICLAYMKIKATLKCKGVPKNKRLTNDRQQYQTSCLFVWNMNTSMCRVERAGHLERLETTSHDEAELPDFRDLQFAPSSPEQTGDDWNPARKEAQELRNKGILNCWGANQPPVKVMSNDSFLKGKSLEEIKHEESGISFVL
ncbi:DDB1- and CUL4-associated factor 15 [Frankliniella fusca]|uniref:DDB1- and CUL4-associated factor 15 n=1 Tax=Frankliniella fusca TaxID=407009 RepID=A0AAE1HX21_9NEOP|nr:DDB1- and CUL4-associated factor 15 [Frankliniella fusca]